MSFDLKLKNVCPHRVVEEVHEVDIDRRTVRFNRSPVNTVDIEVKVNGIRRSREDVDFGYRFVEDDLKLDGSMKLVFNQEIKDTDPLVELSYTTNQSQCRRCNGTGVEMDIRPDGEGEPIRIENEDKLSQAIEKWILTVVGSNEWHTGLGTHLVSSIGIKNIDPEAIQRAFTRDFIRLGDIMRAIHVRQLSFQRMTPRELLDAVESVNVTQDVDDPRIYTIVARYRTATGTRDEIEKKFFLDPDMGSPFAQVQRRG